MVFHILYINKCVIISLWEKMTNNAMRLKMAADNIEICYDSPVPKGFSVIKYGNRIQYSNCSATVKNTKFISNK